MYQTTAKAWHTLCPMHFVPNAPYNIANTSARDTFKLRDPKKYVLHTKPMWLIAFAGELADVVSRVLPLGIFDTSEDTQVRDFPQKSRLGCA